MNKNVFSLCRLALIAAFLVFAPGLQAAAAPEPWRIALIAGGPAFDFGLTLQGLAKKLAELGIIENGSVPRFEDENLAPMWAWLAENAGGDRVRFVADAFYSPEWDQNRRAKVKQDLLERLRGKGDIDCVLAFGTGAAQDIGAEDPPVPVLAIGVSNAVEAGIISSVDDSGRDNLLAAIEPDRYKRQVLIFHQIIHFSKLGIAYEDTPTERSAIALQEIEAAARETGAELLRCTGVFNIGDRELAEARLRACHEDLARQGADAVYLTFNRVLDVGDAAAALAPLTNAGIPTFAQHGSDLVRRGALLSVASDDFREEGIFAAEALGKILDGSLPRSLPQRYKSATVNLAVNLRTATLIGWNLPMAILTAVDEFYRDFRR